VNINLVCVSKTDDGRTGMAARFDAAVHYGRDVFGAARDHVWSDGRSMIFNADRMAGAWKPSTWIEGEDEVFSFSQPPVPVESETTPESYHVDVARIVRARRMHELLPNHFGVHRAPSGEISIWSDVIGFGRAYVIETDHFLAASNHIGILGFFADEPLTLDSDAISRFVHFGWFTEDLTPYRQIKRIAPSTVIEASPEGRIRKREYYDLTQLIGARGAAADYGAMVDQTRRIARNLDALSVRTPTVYLSGGRDSRMTAGVWLSGGSAAEVVTLGTLPAEVDVAEELMSRFFASRPGAADVRHRITMPNPRAITSPIQERLEKSFQMWDGDASPRNLKTNVRIPAGAAALSIGGVGGEFTHGYFYSRPGELEQIQELANPVQRVARSFRGVIPTDEAHRAMDGFYDRIYEQISGFGLRDAVSLDAYYLLEKFRRWGNQALGSMAAVMLSGPAYIRAAFDLTPEERIEKVFPREVLRRALPEWSDVPYYKADPRDSQTTMKNGTNLWDTDPEFFHDVLRRPTHWDRYIRREKVAEFLELVSNEQASPVHESWLGRTIWVEHFATHVQQLNARIAAMR
jgi:hypothetical protein